MCIRDSIRTIRDGYLDLHIAPGLCARDLFKSVRKSFGATKNYVVCWTSIEIGSDRDEYPLTSCYKNNNDGYSVYLSEQDFEKRKVFKEDLKEPTEVE